MRLLEPVSLGRVTARNRIVFGPHETNLGRSRTISARHVAYYARRAEGGCGAIVTETASVLPGDWPYERAPLAEACGPGFAAVATAVHGQGAVALASLGHAGLQGSSAYSQDALWAPSRFADPASREMPTVMGEREIAAVIRGFAAAARVAVNAGMDGVEVDCGGFSLLRQFCSGLTNTRDDLYGSDRPRLAREVLAAVRAAVGDAVVGLRLACEESAPWAGITAEASGALAAALCEHLDYVVAVKAGPFDGGGSRPDGHTAPGFALDLATGLRAAVPDRVLVVAQGSIVDADLAARALESADLVEMTRAQIADPDLAVKLGRGDAPRPCVLCNQLCRVRDSRNPLIGCIGEPAAGHETTEPDWRGRDRPRAVVVIGAGPAGLEAARVAAERGHQVRVVDRAAVTGGAVVLAAVGAGRERLTLLTDWLEAECRRLGVTFDLGTEITETSALPAGSVLLATGALPAPPSWHADLPVLTVREVLAGAELPDGPVVIDDPVGGPVAISVAELLAPDHAITLVTQDTVAGTQLSRTGDLAAANGRLARAGVSIAKRSLVRGGGPEGVVVEDRYTGERSTVPAGCLVFAGHDLPHLPHLPELPAGGAAVLPAAGDVVAPRTIGEAVLEGRRAVLALLTAPAPTGAVPAAQQFPPPSLQATA